MKKILFITAFPPNSKSGGQFLTVNLLHELSKQFSIDLIYFKFNNHNINNDLPVGSIESYRISKYDWLRNIIIYPLFTRRFNKKILNHIKAIAHTYDILFFDYSQVALYSKYLNHPYKILRMHDVIFQKILRENKWLKYWIKQSEGRLLKYFNKIFVLSEKDVSIVKREYGVLAHCVREKIINFNFYETTINAKSFIFIGLWTRKENLDGLIWFMENVYHHIANKSKIQFLIVGDGLDETIKKRYIDLHNNMSYLGFIENPLDIIYKSSAVIAPLFRGAGVKIKVIDAFTTGTPVIGTKIAFEGLPTIKNLNYLAESPQDYVDIICNFKDQSYLEKQKNSTEFKNMYTDQSLSDIL